MAKNKLKADLKKQWDKVCNDYISLLCEAWELDGESYGWWIGNDVGSTYSYGESLFIDMDDVIFCVENDVTYSEYMEWLDYTVWAIEFKQSVPKLSAWHKGCPRVDAATREKLASMKYETERLMEQIKSKY